MQPLSLVKPVTIFIMNGLALPRGSLVAAFAARFVVLLAIPLLFAFYTGEIWEDFFITFRHSENLVRGNGLVYNADERVHGFTSPIGVILPALCDWLTGQRSYLHALWLFRIVTASAFALGGVLIWRAVADGASRWPACFAFLLYAFDGKGVANSANGMETAFMLLLVAWHINLIREGFARHWLAVGMCWAGLLWTRPDGCVYIAALSGACLILGRGARKDQLKAMVKSAVVCSVLYLPWFVWAWSYYGSPVPQTVLAKMNVEHGTTDHLGRALPPYGTRFMLALAKVFGPPYYDPVDTSWHAGLWPLIVFLGSWCASYWVLSRGDRLARITSVAFAFLCAYFASMSIVFPWYLPPAGVLAAVLIPRGLFALTRSSMRPARVAIGAVTGLLALLVGERVYLFTLMARHAATVQEVIETGNRARVGQWLREQIAQGAGNRVYLEPMGYIGYFSGAKVLDWPGLVTPRVVRWRRDYHLDFSSVAEALDPDWLVLRPGEQQRMAELEFFKNNYALARVFDVRSEISKRTGEPGLDMLTFDAVFLVYRKKARLGA
jgi:hypothetical protein